MALPRPQTMATKRQLKNEVAAVIAVGVVNKKFSGSQPNFRFLNWRGEGVYAKFTKT